MRRLLLVLLPVVLLLIPIGAEAREGSRFHEAVSTRLGVVATESPAASRVGRSVLESGGNAVDAAVATAFALSAARPQSCGIGGGGFMLYRSRTGKVRALDFRETAGGATTPTTFAGPGLHRDFTGHLTVGVPGVVAGMDAALDRYGTFSLAEAIAPAEQLARLGVRVPLSMQGAATSEADRLARFAASAALFLPGGQPIRAGSILRQPDLAASLRRIMRGGAEAFYEGTIARRIVRDMRTPRPVTQDAGILTLKDFAAYKPMWRTPIAGTYRGRLVFGFPPPTSGGIAIQQMLNILEGVDLRAAGQSSALADHLIAEAQKIAFADRAAYVADPAFIPQPTATLVSKAYAATRRNEIDPATARTFRAGTLPASAFARRAPTRRTTRTAARRTCRSSTAAATPSR